MTTYQSHDEASLAMSGLSHDDMREALAAMGLSLEDLEAFKVLKKRKAIRDVLRATCLYTIDLESEVKAAQHNPERYPNVMGLLESLQEMHEKLTALGL